MPFRRRSAVPPEVERAAERIAFARGIFEKLLWDFARFFPEDEAERERLRQGLKSIFGSDVFVERMEQYELVRRAAKYGDSAALAYLGHARDELVALLREQGYDATAFTQQNSPYPDI